MAYEALYRRYRPSRFEDAFFGQEHVVAALRNAVEGDRVGHAYLFSGPRGTGKTTSARILAKALNCTNLQGGEPCDACDSCVAFQSGGSYDLHELDAASNNGVDAMRDLIGKVALGSPGRNKVYILDEVHMLSSGAENALLKTLEEPPPHVTFVLCTTEPNKVVPTIRSRTQHLEFSLLSESQVGELVDHVVADAGLSITPEDRSYVIRAGGGSARDTLSALDQVVAAGGAPQGGEHLDALFQALIDRDAGAALSAIDGAMHAGRDAASVATAILYELRGVFLAAMRADLGHMPEAEQTRAVERAASMPPARVTRAIEVIGTSVIEMRQAPDPRVDLEVAIMRLTRTDLDTDPAALVERLEAIERQLSGGAPIAVAPQASAPAGQPAAPVQPEPQVDPPETQMPQQTAPSEQHVAPAPDAQPHQPAPAQAAPVQAAPPPQQNSGGRRGADIVRAALAEQGITKPQPTPAPAAEPTPPPQGASASPPAASQPSSSQPSSSQPDTSQPGASQSGGPGSGKTLADVRRERQAAAQQADTGGAPVAEAGAADVEAAAQARRERQAAAQQGQPSKPEDAHMTQAAVAPQPVPPPPDAPAPQQQAPADQVPQQQGPAHSEPAPQETTPAPEAAAPQASAPPGGALPSLTELEAMWPGLLGSMSGRVRSRFSAGHFVETTADAVQFGLPNPVHRDRCEDIRAEVDEAITTAFGRPIPLVLVVDMVDEEPDFFTAPPSGGADVVEDAAADVREEESVDIEGLVDATDDAPSAEDRVLATFEGSTVLEDPQNQPPDR